MSFVVRSLSADDLNWSDSSVASFSIGAGSHRRSLPVNPRPAYPHDLRRATDVLMMCEELHPLADSPGEMNVLTRDFLTGYNGYAMPDAIYNKPDGSDWSTKILCACGCGKMLQQSGLALTITLAGKSVPPMPSMTRYLVTHEYGHCAWYHSERTRGWSSSDRKKTEAEYMKIRGHKDWVDGKGWHQLAGEVIANDFRVLVTQTEVEHWPHDVEQVDRSNPIYEWWQESAELSARGLEGDK